MKRNVFIGIFILLFNHTLFAQAASSAIQITKTYSQNGRFYIKCVPYDNKLPSLRGISGVYNKKNKLLYSIDRDFNDLRPYGDHLFLSDNGKTIVYIIDVWANEQTDGLKSVSIYKKASLVKSFTLAQFTLCDPRNEKCSLIYYNHEAVVDFDKSNPQKKVFKTGVSEQDQFLDDYAVFCYNDKVYLTDPRKIVHVIDLKTCDTIASHTFNDIYPELKKIKTGQISDALTFDAPSAPDPSFFPNLKNGDTTGFELAKFIGMKAVRLGPDYFKYKVYRVNIGAYISKDGKIEITGISADKPLPADKIRDFFNSQTYNVSFLPKELNKWYFNNFFYGFRNVSDELALKEKDDETKQRELERQRRLTLDSINSIYIPKNLEECFVELDKRLPNVTKNEIRALKNTGDMLNYHFSLGLWIRNNWGLWGGSRLQVYFHDRGFDEPDGTSTIILMYYYDWLNKKETWKEFEEKYPLKIK